MNELETANLSPILLKFSPLTHGHMGKTHVLTLNSAFRVMAGSHLSKEGLLGRTGLFPLGVFVL